MLSVLILTKNEELDLPHCLESVSWSDDVHVFDSFSTDNTVAIASQHGATVTQRQFDGYASQRNAALAELSFKYEWLLILDADERFSEKTYLEVCKALRSVRDVHAGFQLRRRDYLQNTWLKYSQISPFYVRVIRVGKAVYHREINEVLAVNGEVVELDLYFDHYPFSKGITHWVSKHNQYSTMEAERWYFEHFGGERFSIKKALFSKSFSDRRYHQKGLFYKMPGRPVLKWFYMVFWRKAFLDGKAGFTYATLQSIYEYFIVIKSRELMKNKSKSGR